MKVLHIITRMNYGGTAVYLNNLVEGLALQGIEVRLIAGKVERGEVEDPNVNSKRLIRIKHLKRSISILTDLFATWELNREVLRFSPDIIHSHTFKAGMLSRLVKKNEIRLVHSFHGHHLYNPEFKGLKNRIIIFLEKVTSRRCDALVSVGIRVRQELRNSGIGEGKRFVSIPPGISKVNLESREESMSKLGLRDLGRKVVLWSGRFVEVKRPGEVVKVAKEFPDALFIMAGDGPLRESIEQSAPENLRILGWQPRELLLSVADILISTSESEGMPLAVIEAQMCGIPVIAPNVGSMDEVVRDGSTGFLVDSELRILRDRLSVLLDNSQLRSEFSTNAYEWANRIFSRENLVEAHLKLYDEVLSHNV